MYEKTKSLETERTVSMMPKNLQVVSFDSDWKEIYLGTVRKDVFSAFCPNGVAAKDKNCFEVQYRSQGDETIVITTAKWCPLQNCTILVLGK